METKHISIILVVHDQAQQLEENLPLFLAAAQDAGAEVIVVDDMSTDDTPDVLQRMRLEHLQLYTTFLPRSTVMNPSRLRLALSVGAKAAKGEYIVVGDIRRPPVAAGWLAGLADGEAATVYSSRKNGSVTHVVATDLDDLRSAVLKAERKSGRGHRGRWLKRRRGLYDAVAVKRQHAFDLIKLFDQPIGVWRLACLRVSVWL